MLTMILKKIKNKKWLTTCMILGLTFLIATFSCFPMFEAGSVDVMIQNEFEACKELLNRHPLTLRVDQLYENEGVTQSDDLEAQIASYQKTWEAALLNVNVIGSQTRMYIPDVPVGAKLSGRRGGVRIAYMPELTEHIAMLGGTVYTENASEEQGYVCIVPQSLVDNFNLSIGEELLFDKTTNAKDEELHITIAGVFDVSDDKDLYWNEGPNETNNYIYVNKACFDEIVKEYNIHRFAYESSELFDYHMVNHKNMDRIEREVAQIQKENETVTINFAEIMKNYNAGKKTIRVSIWVLQMPILGMVLGFIFMVSKQILDAEKNEMAMLYSRGLKRKQIIFLYTVQSGMISLAAMVIGIPLGYFLCKIAASAKNFLTFSFEGLRLYRVCLPMLGYGLVAALVGLVVIVVPVIGSSKTTIVQHKSSYNFKKKMVWEKFFLDIILLGVSIYLLYTYNANKENVRVGALSGAKMDPMIFINTVLFIVAAGLVMLRLCNYLVRIVYRMGRDKWKPATYASFLQITRNFSKQCFISVFLVLTISMGIFYANSARTINGNHESRIEYEVATDVVVQEKWKVDYFRRPDRKVDYEYIEPGFSLYEKMIEDGVCDKVTKVIRQNDLIVKKAGQSNMIEGCQIMGIHTKEFGETAHFRMEWNRKQHWYHYLNVLAGKSNGVIISSNLAKALDLKEGDKLSCFRNGELVDMTKEVRGERECIVVGIVDNWPGFVRYAYEDDKEKEQYLVVFNYATCVETFKIFPYEVWLKLNKKASIQDVYQYIEDAQLQCKYVKSIVEEKEQLKKDYILQITNGLFTLSFIIAIILCAIGFLIYWISSISQRQLLFGIYRAMGLSVGEINGMLANEHFFSTFLSVLSGAGVGTLASILFTKLFALIYLPKRHNVDIYIEYLLVDYVKLGIVIFVMIFVCLAFLRELVKRMDISKSLKLGED